MNSPVFNLWPCTLIRNRCNALPGSGPSRVARLPAARIITVMALVVALLLLAGCAGPPPRPSTATETHIAIDPAKRTDLVMTAMSLLDTRYRYGGGSPQTGFDCSGLVVFVVNSIASQRLPHNSASLARLARPVPKNALEAGDLVFFNTLGQRHSHVGIYLGDGLFINAPSSGGRVRIDTLSNPYFARRYDGAGSFFSL